MSECGEHELKSVASTIHQNVYFCMIASVYLSHDPPSYWLNFICVCLILSSLFSVML